MSASPQVQPVFATDMNRWGDTYKDHGIADLLQQDRVPFDYPFSYQLIRSINLLCLLSLVKTDACLIIGLEMTDDFLGR